MVIGTGLTMVDVVLDRHTRFGLGFQLTQPDRPAGRGLKLQASPVKQLAARLGLAVAQPQGLKLDGKYAADAAAARELEARLAAIRDAIGVALVDRDPLPAMIARAIGTLGRLRD